MFVTEPLVNHRADGTRIALPVGGPDADPFTPPAKPTPIDSLQPRTRAEVAGTVEAVTETHWAGSPVAELILTDGTGTLLLVFTGRRELAAPTPGAGWPRPAWSGSGTAARRS